MKAEELRIGNLVKLYVYDFYEDAKWKTEDFDIIEVDLVNLESLIKDDEISVLYEPIPLTEEWLLKFGFEEIEDFYDDVQSVYYNGVHYIVYVNNVFTFGLEHQDYNIELKHVHQLQNLYFALTGEELTIKTK